MIDRGKRSVLGVNVSVVDYDSAAERIVTAAKARQALSVSALAVHGVMTGALDPAHKYRLNRFDLVTPDGQPVRWALFLLYGEKLPDRVYGPELTARVCRAACEHGLSVFLYGSRQEVLDAWLRRLNERWPSLKIAGAEPSKFKQLSLEEENDLDKRVMASEADIVLVGLGCPRQEIFVYEHVHRWDRPVLAVGAAFDFHAGLLRQAPMWMQRRGLEWLFRLWMEPSRLWRRYLYYNPLYIIMVAFQRLGIFRSRMEMESAPEEPLRYG